MSELYALSTTPQGYRVIKYDEWTETLVIHDLTLRRGWLSCDCFAANRETCRHRELVALFNQYSRTDKGWLYDWTNSQWIKPVNPNRRRT